MEVKDIAVRLINEGVKITPDGFEFYSDRHGMLKQTKHADWAFWVDGLPVVKPLMLLAQRIRAKMPKVKFGCTYVRDGQGYENSVGAWVFAFHELAVYRDEDDYALGAIGYKGYIAKNSKVLYGVGSPKINKRNVSRNNEMRFYATTENIDKAVSLACTYLTPRPAAALAELTYRDFASAVENAADRVVGDARKFIMRCGSSSVLDTELRNLIRLGVSFVTPEFRDAAAQFLAADTQAAAIKMQRVGAYYIQMRSGVDGEIVADVCTFTHDVKHAKYSQTPEQTARLRESELSEDIQHKIALLSMMECGTYVPEIGLKVADKTYWIERVL